MDPVSKRFLSHGSETLSPIVSPGSSIIYHPYSHSSSSSFPIIAIAVIGMLATAFLLVSYYVFVIKCCLNWHRIDLLRRFSPSARHEDPLAIYSPRPETRGLDEAVIRLIPVIQYKSEKGNFSSECSVCLNEFREEEKLKILPNCSHVFHIDCIDVWLQNNANCPLCRTSISVSQIDQNFLTPRDGTPHSEDFVVIELGTDRNGRESPVEKKGNRRVQKVTSMSDECIENRGKDGEFSVKHIRRSVSMDSSGDRQFYLAVQEALRQQNRQVNSIEGTSSGSGSGSGRVKISSFFSFGHSSSRSRSAVLPVYLDP